MNSQLVKDQDDHVLRRALERLIADKFGDRATIAGIRRTRIRNIGSYNCDVVSIQLSNGKQFELFLKDFAFSRQSKDNPRQRRDRELAVYRDLLPRADLGTPEYYGSVWDESHGRFWLFLELVQGVVIKDHNVQHGTVAARWLGKMHGFFHKHPEYLTGCDFLLRHDAEFFRNKAEDAVQNVAQIAPGAASQFAKVRARYESVIQTMSNQPLTLVHGGYIPWHILLDFSVQPKRVCPIDWELAALGAPLYDLAYFTDWVDSLTCDQVWAAYRQAATQFNAPVPNNARMRYLVECFRLHRIFDWLSRGIEKQFSEKKVARLVAQAELQSASVLT